MPVGNPNLAAEGVAYRFRPGVSGNPSGKPKRRPFDRALDLVRRTKLPLDVKGKLKQFAGRRLDVAAAMGLLLSAAEGNPAAFKEARLAVQGPDEESVRVTHRYVLELPRPLTEAEWFEQNAGIVAEGQDLISDGRE